MYLVLMLNSVHLPILKIVTIQEHVWPVETSVYTNEIPWGYSMVNG